MNDEIPTALIIVALGLGILAYCTVGIVTEVRSRPTGKPEWGSIVFTGLAILVGLLIVAMGAVYLHVLLYSTDL
jgi:hypothetical protein